LLLAIVPAWVPGCPQLLLRTFLIKGIEVGHSVWIIVSFLGFTLMG